jgi:hypothetical protein
MAKLKSGTRIYGNAIIDNQLVVSSGGLNITGVSTFSNNVELPDNVSLYFGNSDDLRIFHDGSNSIIDDIGTGSIVIRSDTSIALRKRTGDENQLVAIPDGAIELYHNNTKRFETTGVGATVFGNLNVSGEAQLNRVAITTTATNITMQAGRTYPYYSSITLTLPTSPTAGDKVEIINRSNTSTAVVARNGSNIMGLAEDMTIDLPDVGFTLIYANVADGWIIGK